MVQLGQRFMLIFPVPLQGHALHQFHTDAYCWIFYCRFGFGVCIVIEQTSEVVIAAFVEVGWVLQAPPTDRQSGYRKRT